MNIRHNFYTEAPAFGPVYTVQYFNLDDASKDQTIHTDEVMNTIKHITNGESFYYQFDNPDNAAHCVTAHFDDDLLVIELEIVWLYGRHKPPNQKLSTRKDYSHE